MSFLTPLIRSKGLTIEKFCKSLDINRQSFYRQVKKSPVPFTEDLLNKITNLLSLSSQQIQELYSYTILGERSSNYSTNRFAILSSIITTTAPLAPIAGSKTSDAIIDYAFYQNSRSIINMPASDVAKELINSITLNETDLPTQKKLHNFTITIYNCLENPSDNPYELLNRSTTKTSSLARLFYSLDNISGFTNDIFNIKVSHYIPGYDKQKKSSIELFRNLLPLLSTVRNYSYDTRELNDVLWSQQNDMCIIKYSQMYIEQPSTKKHKYFIIKFNNRGIGYIRCVGPNHENETEAQSIYHYFTHDCRNEICGKRNQLVGIEVLNSLYLYLHTRYKHILLSSDFCYDTLPYSVWKDYQNNLTPEHIQILASLISPTKKLTFDESNLIVSNLLKIFEKRYDINNKSRSICVYSELGLRNFIKNQMIHDLYLPLENAKIKLPTFNKTQLLRILEELLIQVKNTTPEGIRVYIFNNNYRENAYNFLIYKDYGIESLSPINTHLDSASNMYECPDTSTQLYNYILTLIEQRNNSEVTTFTPIKDDDSAISFVKSLIEQVKKME